ncbi:cell division protein ZapA [Gammaproteobacteria bacterium]|jgi:hypothetical protein|nr:cell division protein ZapA [Gammaproteobacteria bacterium]MDB9747365.1 cell division protein ZapA [Gammaproteobacteria bacterium]MDB9763615.1 cell division protein ZapA [Gammaproteobacteria bacterium]|tara:strand:- start:214 stop:480 length:267 start_codon:yes stop_codon:yes gene_type:complete
MSEMETLSLRIFGRDLTLSCPAEEKDQLIEAANFLNTELDAIGDKNNALVIVGLSFANRLLSNPSASESGDSTDLLPLINKIESILEK